MNYIRARQSAEDHRMSTLQEELVHAQRSNEARLLSENVSIQETKLLTAEFSQEKEELSEMQKAMEEMISHVQAGAFELYREETAANSRLMDELSRHREQSYVAETDLEMRLRGSEAQVEALPSNGRDYESGQQEMERANEAYRFSLQRKFTTEFEEYKGFFTEQMQELKDRYDMREKEHIQETRSIEVQSPSHKDRHEQGKHRYVCKLRSFALIAPPMLLLLGWLLVRLMNGWKFSKQPSLQK